MLLSGKDISSALDIIYSTNKIIQYSKGYSEESLLEDERTIDAITLHLISIGNETNSISNIFIEKFNQIDWTVLSFLCIENQKSFYSEKKNKYNE